MSAKRGVNGAAKENARVAKTEDPEGRSDVWSSAGMQGHGKGEIPEKTCRPAASSNTIPTCENPGATPPGIDFSSPWWRKCTSHCATAAAIPKDSSHTRSVTCLQ
ncbi:hypothetical protein PR048_025266 [Dryococelus australis]|uniref:Uncharacterized protein n=1 Tax=Dryococelus australis TaxID=614101 RepID=A0ABQ9GQX6_9NEOP|nr:hypothetical protein PR048_025266 [Dryococelus australis]